MKLNVKEIVLFGMLGALMFASKLIMQVLPNIHLIGVFIVAITVVFRAKALFPLYIFIFLDGLINFSLWWLPYLYVWLPLWGAVMLLPKKLPQKRSAPVYMTVCALHGLLFGILYAPAQALFFDLSLQETLVWIAAGLPFDLIHGVGNFVCGLLILPLITVLQRATDQLHK